MKNFLSKFLSVVTVFTMTFSMAFAQTIETPKVESISFEKTEVSKDLETKEEETKEEKTEDSEEKEGEVAGVQDENTDSEIQSLEVSEDNTSAERGVVTPVVVERKGSITVCKAIAKKVGEDLVFADPSEVSGYEFTIPWVDAPGTPGTEGFNVQPKLSPDANFTADTFTPNKKIFENEAGGEFDAECETFSDLPLGSYFYGEEEITGGDDSVTWTTRYSDQVLIQVEDFEDTYAYADNLFTSGFDTSFAGGNKDADGYLFNTNSDGHIVLNRSNTGRDRTIVVLNIFEDTERELSCNVEENLILNGGFESPVVTNGSGWDIYDDGTPGLEWNVEWRDDLVGPLPTTAKLELHRGVNGWASDEGSQHAELDTDFGYANNEEASVRISQDITTIPGQAYRLSYAFSPRPGTGDGQNILKIFIDGVHEDTQSTGAQPAGPTAWMTYTFEFVAHGAVTNIAFQDSGYPNTLGTFLDDVKVNCIDEIDEEEEEGGEDEGEEEDSITFCHVPNGNGQNPQTLTLSESGANGHLSAHDGDYLGPCQTSNNNQETEGGNPGSSSSSSSRSGSFGGGSVLGASTEGEVLGACVGFTQYHRKGDKGGEVAKIQEFLNEHMNAGLVVDGFYGETTAKAVGAFQQKYFEQIIMPWVPFFKPKPTERWYKSTRMMANELVNCPEEKVFLEDPKIFYKVKWEVKETN